MKTLYIKDENKKHIWHLYKREEPNILLRVATYNKKTNILTIDVGRCEGIYSANTFASLVKIANEGSE